MNCRLDDAESEKYESTENPLEKTNFYLLLEIDSFSKKIHGLRKKTTYTISSH